MKVKLSIQQWENPNPHIWGRIAFLNMGVLAGTIIHSIVNKHYLLTGFLGFYAFMNYILIHSYYKYITRDEKK